MADIEHSVSGTEATPGTKPRPIVTYAIMAICIILGAISITLGPYIFNLGAKVNDLIAAGEYWRLLTSIFLHIGLIHLVFNMVFLYTIGPGVEGLFGKTRYILIFLLAGLLGSVASFALTPAISAGASGALFGLLGAYLYFWLKNPQAGKQIGKAVVQLVIYNLVFGLLVKVVDNWAHLGGLAGGFLAAAILGLPGEGRRSSSGGLALLAYTGLLAAGLWFGVVQ